MKYLQFCLLLLLPYYSLAQNSSSSINALITNANAHLGTNDNLVNGRPFIQKNLKAAGSPFFRPTLGKIGTVFTKLEKFEQQRLRYNLVQDALILSTTLPSGIPFEIVLNENIVDSFSIGQHFFINKKNITHFKSKEGYVERIFQGNFTFYRLQKVTFTSQFTEKNPYGKFTDTKVRYYISISGNLTEVSSLKDFAKLFPDQKKAIARFAKKEKIRFRKASLSQLTQLMNFCNEKI